MWCLALLRQAWSIARAQTVGGPAPPRVLSPLRLFATFCVVAPTVAVIAVPTYDSATPKLGGFPFFYWYQLLLVPVVAFFCWLCTVLVKYRPPAGTGAADSGETGQ